MNEDQIEFLSGYAPVNVWRGDSFTDSAIEAYPYLIIDFLAAWPNHHQTKRIIDLAERIMNQKLIYNSLGEYLFGEFPTGTRVFRTDGEEDVSCGYYRRRIWSGRAKMPSGEWMKLVIWHRHDGYSGYGTQVEMWVYQ